MFEREQSITSNVKLKLAGGNYDLNTPCTYTVNLVSGVFTVVLTRFKRSLLASRKSPRFGIFSRNMSCPIDLRYEDCAITQIDGRVAGCRDSIRSARSEGTTAGPLNMPNGPLTTLTSLTPEW